MKSLRQIIPALGLILAAFLGVAAGAAAESKSQRISRLRGQLCTSHLNYLERAAITGAELYSALDALDSRLPNDESTADVGQLVAQTAYELDELLQALDLQLAVAVNACSNLAAGIKQPELTRTNDDDQQTSKSAVIRGLRGELCGLYVDNLAEILFRGDWIIEALAAIQADPTAATVCRSARIDLSRAEDQLRQLVATTAIQFFVSERVCLAIAEQAAKRDFWRAAEAGLRPGPTTNPYLVLLLIYD
jgi:hypothetical protein